MRFYIIDHRHFTLPFIPLDGLSDQIGHEMLRSAETILDKKLDNVFTIAIPGDLKPESVGHYADQVKAAIEMLDKGQGVLIVTDLFGATPSNLAHYFAAQQNVIILSGLNLSMLIRIINYADQPLELLAKIGIVGANKGITEASDL